MDSKRETIVPEDLAHIIETMQRWIDGEPVWPYAKIIETWGEHFEMYRRRWARQLDEKMRKAEETGVIEFEQPGWTTKDEVMGLVMRGVSMYQLRDVWIDRFGFAIPCAELLDELARHRKVVEVGAGSGYMTRLMLNRGTNVTGSNPARSDYTFEHGAHAALDAGEAKTMARRYPDATIFCSWPTLNHTWFRQLLKAMHIGQTLIVIRESACAEHSAWEYLDDCFDELRTIDIPTFEHMNDIAAVYIKKRQRPRHAHQGQAR